MKKEIKIGVGSGQETAQEFVKVWRGAEGGKEIKRSIEHLYFQDLETLLQVLTPKRLELLQVLRSFGPVSVRALSKKLERDYKNVHLDIQSLERVGLVVRNKAGRLFVPWKKIIAELQLAA